MASSTFGRKRKVKSPDLFFMAKIWSQTLESTTMTFSLAQIFTIPDTVMTESYMDAISDFHYHDLNNLGAPSLASDAKKYDQAQQPAKT
jgi:hypothetical protein